MQPKHSHPVRHSFSPEVARALRQRQRKGMVRNADRGFCRLTDEAAAVPKTAKAEAWAPAFALVTVLSLALNVELLRVQGCVALDEDVFTDELFEFGNPARVIRFENLHGLRVDAKQYVGVF